MPKSKAYIGHLMILATTFIYSFNTNFMKVIIPEWIGPNGLVLLRCSASTLVFCSSVSYSFFLILIKPYTQKFDSVTVMKWMSLSSMIISLPFGLSDLVRSPLFSAQAPLHIWLEICYILFVATVIGYFLSVYALNYITPFVESAYKYVLPVTGAAVSILMGLQKFSWHDPIALALIVTGFILINKKTNEIQTNHVSIHHSPTGPEDRENHPG